MQITVHGRYAVFGQGREEVTITESVQTGERKLSMLNFVQYTPTKILFGRDMEKETGKEIARLGGTRVLIVYGGGSIVRSGLLKTVEDSIREAGLEYVEFGGAQPNPLLSHALEGIALCKKEKINFVLAIGGGSSIDTAKGIADGSANPDCDFWDLWMGKVPLEKTLPIGVVLTIAAAGSETSNSAVLTNEETGIKKGLTSDVHRPLFAIMDPALLATVPSYHIACGIVDIMMHTLDRYFVPGIPGQLTDEIAEGLLRTMIDNGPAALQDPSDYDAMAEVMWAGSVSHNEITGLGRGTRDFPVHGMTAPLSAHFDAIHGATLAAMWGHWAEYVYECAPERFARYARKVWGVTEEDDLAASREGIARTMRFFKSLGMPVSVRELMGRELTEEEICSLAADATGNDTKKLCRAKALGQAEVEEIYRNANR